MDATVVTALNTWVSGLADDLAGLLVTNVPIIGAVLASVIGIFFLIKFAKRVLGR